MSTETSPVKKGPHQPRGRFWTREMMATEVPVIDVKLNRDIRNYVAAANRTGGTNLWNDKPEIPSANEVLGLDEESEASDMVDLVPNQIQGPWPASHVYLKAHYDLLREDAVAPLRDAVAYYKETPWMEDSSTVAIYEKLYITGMTFTHNGIALRVQFSTARAGRNIVWEYSKRLVSGSIVALTPSNDNFQTKCVIAIVAARPLEGVKNHPSEVDLFFARPEDADFDTQLEWTMVEAKSGYYESARHTLTALQAMVKERFPLSEYLCDLNSVIDAPEYIKLNPVIDISSVVPDNEHAKEVDIVNDWPQAPTKILDSSQWSALHQILTKKLSIIQGPPGTGKTHVSVVALRILLANMRAGDSPIIIAAQTNHALDQLLRHISEFERDYVRLGGRSTDQEIRTRTVFALRQKASVPDIPGGMLGPAKKRQRRVVEEIAELVSPFNLENAGSPLPALLFLKLGLITQDQYDSMLLGAEGWVQSGEDDKIDPVTAWLGESQVKFEVIYKSQNFGFVEEEIDLEYEQLKELEAEQGLDDEDYESLKGQYTHLKEGFRGGVAGAALDEKAFGRYMKNQDLWKIPENVRGAVYNALQTLAKNKIRGTFRNLVKAYNTVCSEIKIGKWERDMIILESAKVIGMTTTGLSKYRALVSSLKPKTIMIEEAAEIIESPVTVACVESLQHLILVGDHKQLQGNCSVQELEGDPFFLNVSMFERLVHNGIEFKNLTRQRRMAPEIRALLAPIYDDLEDHPSVIDRPGIRGMGEVNSFFFCHSWPECSDSLMSKYNDEEAQMVVNFYLYLNLNGLPVEGITVLTFYNGQRKKILKALKTVPYLQGHYIKVNTVDSYQGEENEVVLLSLVRSSSSKERGNIGFLSIENRVCVALSRAKRGFYIFGNAEVVSVDPLWWQIVQIMGKKPRRLGFHLPVTCVQHNQKTFINSPPQFQELSGGCQLQCGGTLRCGHPCTLTCHAIPHAELICESECRKSLACGHRCTKPCSDLCECDCSAWLTNQAKVITRSRSHTGRSSNTGPSHTGQSIQGLGAELPAALAKSLSLQRYQEYADGGAKIEDARLGELMQKQASEEEQKRLDAQSYEDLFGNEAPMASGIQQPVSTTVKQVPDGKGGSREKRIYHYSSQATPSKPKRQEHSLLDLDT